MTRVPKKASSAEGEKLCSCGASILNAGYQIRLAKGKQLVCDSCYEDFVRRDGIEPRPTSRGGSYTYQSLRTTKYSDGGFYGKEHNDTGGGSG